MRPPVIVCLGVTAAQALLGRSFQLTQERRRFREHPWVRFVTATLHPSAVLRAPEPEQREDAYRRLLADLKAAHVAGHAPSGGERSHARGVRKYDNSDEI